MKKIYFLLFTFVLVSVQIKLHAQVVTLDELTGKWTLTKVEIIKMQGNTELDRQDYTPSNYDGKIYFEKIECLSDGQIIYSGIGDEALLAESGIFHSPNNVMIVFQNSLIGYTFDFSWEDKPILFILEKTATLNQQNKLKERIRFFYQKKEL